MERAIIREKSVIHHMGVFVAFVVTAFLLFKVLGDWGDSSKNGKLILIVEVMVLIMGLLLSMLVLLKFESAEFETVGSGLVVGKVYPTVGIKQKALIRIQMEDGQVAEVECSKEHFHLLRVGDVGEIKSGRIGKVVVPSIEVAERNANSDLFKECSGFKSWREDKMLESFSTIAWLIVVGSLFLLVAVALYVESMEVGTLLFLLAFGAPAVYMSEEVKALKNVKEQDVVYADSGIVKEVYFTTNRTGGKYYKVKVVSDGEEFIVDITRLRYKNIRVGEEVRIGIVRGQDPFIV